MFKNTVTALSIAGLSLTGITVASPAFAVENNTIQSVTESALENLGVENASPELIEEISNNITDAINSETTGGTTTDGTDSVIIDPEIIDNIDNGEVIPPEVLDENLEKQTKLWDTVKSDWLEAFEVVRADFEECVAAGTAANECSAGLGFRLQIAHGEAMLNNYEQRLADIANLPEAEQAEALAKLEQHRQRTLDRLEKANQLLADHIANGTPLPEGVKIKNIQGEAELVNGLLAELGSSEKAIPADARKIQRNEDGTVTVQRQNGETSTVSPRKPSGTQQAPVNGEQPVQPNGANNGGQNQPAPRPQQGGQTSPQQQNQGIPPQDAPSTQPKPGAPAPRNEQKGQAPQLSEEQSNSWKGTNTNG